MSELTIHTGGAGDITLVHVDWFDENNIPREDDIEIRIVEQDKPRTLVIRINGQQIWIRQ